MRQGHPGNGSGGGYPTVRSGYDELDTTLMPPRPGEQQQYATRSGASPAQSSVTAAAAAVAAPNPAAMAAQHAAPGGYIPGGECHFF